MAQSDASIEADLELKKRARRRLVGAAALALFAAIVLPMVMDHEPRPPVQDIQVRIPSQDGNEGFKSHILPGKPAPTPLPPAATVAEAKPAPEPKADAKARPASATEPKAEAKSEPKPEPRPAPPEAKPEAPAAKAAAAPAEKHAQAAAAKAPEKPHEKPAEPAKPAEPKGEEAHAAASGAEQWVVQLGAYKEAGNVKLLLAKLKEMGVPAYTEKFDSPQGPRTRVRAGPFATKEAAEKARAKAKIIGVDGPVAPK